MIPTDTLKRLDEIREQDRLYARQIEYLYNEIQRLEGKRRELTDEEDKIFKDLSRPQAQEQT